MTTRYGTAKSDSLLISDSTITLIYGLGGNDTIHATAAGAQTLDGGSGKDMLFGYAGNDSLRGGTSNDTLSGGWGNDRIDGGTDAPPVDDVYVDPWDSDTVSYAYGRAMTIDLAAGTATTRLAALPEGMESLIETDVLIDIENVIGSVYDDHIFGDDQKNRIEGNYGDDYILAGAGKDEVYGGSGNDIGYGDNGDDKLYGGTGDDGLHDGGGRDLLEGEAGNDILYADALDNGGDTLNGGAGHDTAFMKDLRDRYDGGEGFDGVGYNQMAHGVRVDLGAGTVGRYSEAMPAYQTLFNVESAAGSAFRDYVKGSDAYNFLSGGGGDDMILGGGGGDLLDGGTGNDVFYGGTGGDSFQFYANQAVDQNQRDTIMDFGAGDRIRFTTWSKDFGFDDLDTNRDGKVTGADTTADLINGNLVLTISAAQSWTVQINGVTSLTEAQFYFV